MPRHLFTLLLSAMAAHATAWAEPLATAAAASGLSPATPEQHSSPVLTLPRTVTAALQRAGMGNQALFLSVRPVDTSASTSDSVALSAQGDQPAVLASTTKLITALASLDLLGVRHRWRTRAYLTGPLREGVLEGDLRLVGGGDAQLTSEQLVTWFKRMRARGLQRIRGRILIDRQGFALADNDHAHTPPPTADNPHHAWPDAFTVDGGHITATLTAGPRGSLITQLAPAIGGIQLVDELRRKKARCEHLAEEPRLQLENTASGVRAVLRGDWSPACPTLRVRTGPDDPGLLTAATVRAAWLAAGGIWEGEGQSNAADTVGEATKAAPVWPVVTKNRRAAKPPAPWAVWDGAPLPEVLREMNKWSDNIIARHLMLSLAPGFPSRPATLPAARERLEVWLRGQGFSADDLTLDNGSGLAIVERGRPHALTKLLTSAWQRGPATRPFIDSLPKGGVDGTLSHRLHDLPRGAQAWLKTGSLSQARGLAGYVQAKSGRVYAVAALLNHPNAPRGEFALDTFIRYLAQHG